MRAGIKQNHGGSQISAKLNRCVWPAIAAGVLYGSPGSLLAASDHWDGLAAVGNKGDGVNWTDADNWTSNGLVDALPSTTAPGDDITFGSGMPATINLDGNELANSLTFNAGFTLDAPATTHTLTLSSGTVGVGAGVSAAINSNLTGNGGLTLPGAGMLTLRGDNSYVGPTNVNAGTLVISSASALPTTQLNINPGAALLINASTNSSSSFTNDGEIKIAANQSLAPHNGALNQNAGTIEVGPGGTLDTGTAFMSFEGGTITLDAGATPAVFKPNSIDAGGTSGTETIASGPVGAGQASGHIDLSEGNLYAPVFSVAPGAAAVQMIVSAPISNGHLTTAGGGVLELSGDNTYSQGTGIGLGTVIIAAADAIPTAGGITIEQNGLLQLAPGIGAPATQGLTVNRGGGLDITNDRLLIDYGSGADPISQIADDVANGYANGAWDGVAGNSGDTFNGGIFSSTAAANSKSYGVGYADSADPGNPAGLPSGTIEVKYTLLGDANLDGEVNGTDFAILATHFNQSVSSWDEGDFNYDDKVNGGDFTLLAANFNQGASAGADVAAVEAFAQANGLTSSVPEPGCAAALALAGAAVLFRRRSCGRIV